jgi:hypothetical protein
LSKRHIRQKGGADDGFLVFTVTPCAKGSCVPKLIVLMARSM